MYFAFREEAEVRFFTSKGEDIFSSQEFTFKLVEDASDVSFERRQVGVITLATETIRGTFVIVDGDPSGIFDVDKDSGVISTSKPVDRERNAAFELKIVVAIFGTKTFSECLVKIEIDDLNDNSPIFVANEPKLIFAKSDSAIGQPIHRVVVEDGDFGDNGRLGFTLEDKSGYFLVDENEGERINMFQFFCFWMDIKQALAKHRFFCQNLNPRIAGNRKLAFRIYVGGKVYVPLQRVMPKL